MINLCSDCGVTRLLPGRNESDQPVCVDCAGITQRFECAICGRERRRFRKDTCAECSIRSDLDDLLGIREVSNSTNVTLREHLLRGDRPESVYTWMRNPKVRETLAQMGSGQFNFTHDGLDELPRGRHVQHLRAILVEADVLPRRDEALYQFERWLEAKLTPLTLDIRRPVERVATWHHLRSMRRRSTSDTNSFSAVHNARQSISAAILFLSWLKSERGRLLAACRQADVDMWLSSGPSTRHNVRQFLVVAIEEKLAPPLALPYRTARSTRRVTHAERIEWIRRCLQDEVESPAASTAALLLLLYAQPLVRICRLRLDAIKDEDGELYITFGEYPVWVPTPFAHQVRRHLEHRALAHTRPVDSNPYLFPGGNAGAHITSTSLMTQVRSLGINLLAAKNTSLTELVTQMPAPIVADALGYSYQITAKYVALAADNFARYVSSSPSTSIDKS